MCLASCLALCPVPRTPPCSQPLQGSQLAFRRRGKRRPLRPRAGWVLLPQKLQYMHMASSSGCFAGPLIPGAGLRRASCQPLHHLHVARPCSRLKREPVPLRAMRSQPVQRLKLPSPCCRRTCEAVPWAGRCLAAQPRKSSNAACLGSSTAGPFVEGACGVLRPTPLQHLRDACNGSEQQHTCMLFANNRLQMVRQLEADAHTRVSLQGWCDNTAACVVTTTHQAKIFQKVHAYSAVCKDCCVPSCQHHKAAGGHVALHVAKADTNNNLHMLPFRPGFLEQQQCCTNSYNAAAFLTEETETSDKTTVRSAMCGSSTPAAHL
eukprot:GHRQ01002826.1.p1 GENE.GHRQ01002826.1~~GHRQ01002826.1.p1  ORF type:complete len:321 (-),score=40.05 GHRQ01002826.1:623-1585(-)